MAAAAGLLPAAPEARAAVVQAQQLRQEPPGLSILAVVVAVEETTPTLLAARAVPVRYLSGW